MRSALTPQQLFNKVTNIQPKRSRFNRDHLWSGTFDGDVLIPIFWDYVNPGDIHELSLNSLIRYNTLLHPIQAHQVADFHFFFVPSRLYWDNFKFFMGEQPDPDSSIDFLYPTITSPTSVGYGEKTNYDYFGIPTKVPELEHRADLFRALNLTWNRWYRDQNLQNSLPVNNTSDGPDDPADYAALLPRGKRKDYFTSAYTEPQKGAAVTISLGSTAPVVAVNGGAQIRYTSDDSLVLAETLTTLGSGTMSSSPTNSGVYLDPNGTLNADLSASSLVTINALRQYNALQCFLERDMRGGTRYNELTYNHFNTMSPDARVQDPEIIGSISSNVNIHAIQQTGESGTTPQGNLAAMGTITARGKCFNKHFTEHGVIFGLMSVRTDQMYQAGLNRMHSYSTRYDNYWPDFAHLGNQAILNKEIYAQGAANPTADAAVFGYAGRYDEQRYKESYVTGDYRSNAAASLDSWGLWQEFSSLPTLSAAFIVENNPYDRVVAVTSQADFNGQIFFDYKSTRPIPLYSIPSLMDRL